jgi:hypothetical protein
MSLAACRFWHEVLVWDEADVLSFLNLVHVHWLLVLLQEWGKLGARGLRDVSTSERNASF